MTEVVNIRDTGLQGVPQAEWPDEYVYIGRPGRGFEGPYGNPIRPGTTCQFCGQVHRTGQDTLPCFKQHFEEVWVNHPEILADVAALHGKKLVCFCKPADCHGDLLAEEADKYPPIRKFQGTFLSNFWPCQIKGTRLTYPSAEHAYQAAKTTDEGWREKIASSPHPAEAKRLGREAPQRPDWNDIKLDVMRKVVSQKFDHDNWDLMEDLFKTHPHYLIEENTWGDNFWGVCRGRGQNHLGKILMKQRVHCIRVLTGYGT